MRWGFARNAWLCAGTGAAPSTFGFARKKRGDDRSAAPPLAAA